MVKTVQSNYFTDEMKNDMLGTKSEVFLPSLSADGSYTFSTKNMTYSELMHLIGSVTSVLANSTLETFRNTTNFEYIFLWKNRLLFIDYFEVFCDILTARNFEHLNAWSNIIIGVMSTLIGLFTIYLIVFWVIVGGYMKASSKLFKLYKFLPKDEVGKLFHELEKKTSQLNQRIEFRKSNLLSPSNVMIYFLALVFLLTYISVGLIFFEALYNSVYNRQAISKVQHGTEITHDLTKITFGSFQSLFDDTDYLQYTHDELYEFAKRYNTMDEYTDFRYGTEDAGYYNLIGMTSSIDTQVEHRGTDAKCKNYTLINFDISQIECMSMDELINANAYYLAKQVEDIYKKKYSEEQLLATFWKNYLVYIQTRKKSWGIMLESVDYFTSRINQRIISGLACALPALVALLAYMAFRTYSRINKERSLFLLMLFQVPCDVLDNLDPIKNYIFNRSFDSGKKNKQLSLDGRSEVKAVCDAAVDGMILCTSVGVIEIFNTASETMFGYKSTDVLGLSLTKLFEKEGREKVENILARLRQSNETMGETLELVCLRKNDRKFPTRVSLSVSLLSTSNNMKKSVITCFIKDITTELKHNNLIKEEKMKSEALLLNILPEPVANRLKAGETNIYENFKDVTCFFSDIVGFTTMSSTMEPNQVVAMLNEIVNQFDILCDSYDLEKIKTIGDAYFCCGGLHNCMQSDHPEKVVRFAIDTLGVIYIYNTQNNTTVNIRVGVHTGSVVAGVLGIKKFAYDLWGDAVNTASRMESTGLPGRVQISRDTYERVHDLFEFDLREIEVKGKGKMKTYVVKEKHHQNPNKESPEITSTTILRNRLGESSSAANLFQAQQNIDHENSVPNLLQLTIPDKY
ncbi:predicted protein [Naegleria gruberi]|uniref:Predicted protein n=1 Tax=Naegleria gruberi TaxID=5762 RepID=D2VF55_NAEGR|nr:uncharacterized protein NAEGRDRAFT_49034 [Naegleria gruberi]EFC44625.1 predicted protein [Naegleria gruberi]|eukprot:XP_002677369.1 predicted protein [Naegleria gruberi strain NEG-M]